MAKEGREEAAAARRSSGAGSRGSRSEDEEAGCGRQAVGGWVFIEPVSALMVCVNGTRRRRPDLGCPGVTGREPRVDAGWRWFVWDGWDGGMAGMDRDLNRDEREGSRMTCCPRWSFGVILSHADGATGALPSRSELASPGDQGWFIQSLNLRRINICLIVFIVSFAL